ncbi:MAG: vanadium-dependent haloperoxidase [Actinomycetota bacterium]|nr:vanadium-dependent haloperoxidase [Actinomycetota bacterium]
MSDAVTQWNDVLLDVVRQVGGPPGPIARGGAMMHGAIYDAVNSIVPTHEPYLVRVGSTPTASLEAAIAHAAHDTLAAAFPATTVGLAAELASALAALPDPATQIAAGKAVGREAAHAMIQARSADGADVNTPYVSGNQPGDWRPTGSGDAASPNWPAVKPFCMASGMQFRPPRPGGYLSKAAMLRSDEYAAQFNEVKDLGEATSMARTAEQEEIALFWANDLDGTSKPPGQLFEITKAVSDQKGLDVVENARLLALVALAMGDAAICAWDAKYSTDLDLWRPETAIGLANQDGNPATSADTGWEPLSQNAATGDRFSPPFPAYVSGHATFAAAHAGIMRRYFGTDNVTFTATSEDPNLPSGVTRSFNSFTEAARENARSRVYLGVHFQWDGDHGFLSGNALAEHVHGTCLRPLVP